MRPAALYVLCVAAAIAIGLALRWPALRGAYLADDFDHYAISAGIYPVARAPLDMFNFVGNSDAERRALLASGRLPWWTARDIQLSVLRPLSSALCALDFAVLGGNPELMHLHSMLWWVVLLAAVAALLASLLPAKIAAFGVLLYAVDEAHGLPVTWSANRSELIAVGFVTWGLWAHVAHRTRGWRAGRLLSLACVSLGLLAGEHAFAPLAYFVAFELVAMHDGSRQRLRALWPVFALGVGYLCVRHLMGYGIVGSGVYVDPLTAPLRYAAACVLRLPLLFGDLALGLGAEWYYMGPPFLDTLLHGGVVPAAWRSFETWQRAQLAAGVLSGSVIVLSIYATRRTRSEPARSAHWLLVGSVLSLAPVCSTLPMSRLTLTAAIGVDAALAVLTFWALDAALRPGGFARRAGAASLCVALFSVHVVCAAIHTRSEVSYYVARSQLEETWVLGAEIDDRAVRAQDVVLLSVRDWTSEWVLPFVRHLHGLAMPRSTALLSAVSDSPLDLVRVAPNVLELLIRGVVHPGSFTGSVYRPDDAPLRTGQKLACAHFDVDVLAATSGEPTRLRFTFPRSIDDPRYLFLYPRSQGLMRLQLPPVGETLRLPQPAWPSSRARKH